MRWYATKEIQPTHAEVWVWDRNQNKVITMFHAWVISTPNRFPCWAMIGDEKDPSPPPNNLK